MHEHTVQLADFKLWLLVTAQGARAGSTCRIFQKRAAPTLLLHHFPEEGGGQDSEPESEAEAGSVGTDPLAQPGMTPRQYRVGVATLARIKLRAQFRAVINDDGPQPRSTMLAQQKG